MKKFTFCIWFQFNGRYGLLDTATAYGIDGFDAAKRLAKDLRLQDWEWQSSPENGGKTRFILRNDTPE